MTALKVIGIIVLIFILIGLIRAGAVVRFGEALELKILIGPFRITLLPAKERKAKPPEEKKLEEPAEKKKKEKTHTLPKLTKDELRSLIETALAALKETARRACRRLRIDPLEVLVVFGGADPADIAQAYGYASAAMWGVMPHLEDLFNIPDPSLHLRMDYGAKKTRAEGTAGVSFRIWDGLVIAFALFVPMLKWYRRFRRAHKSDRTAETTTGATENRETQDEKLTA